MSDPIQKLGEKTQSEFDRIDATHKSSETIKLETEGIFDSDGYPLPPGDDPFSDSPMRMLAGMMGDLKDMALHRGPFAMPSAPQSEHKVKIFRLPEIMAPAEIESVERAIERFLNDGYCCHLPTVINDYVIMDFSRRKDNERQERQTNNDGSDKENGI